MNTARLHQWYPPLDPYKGNTLPRSISGFIYQDSSGLCPDGHHVTIQNIKFIKEEDAEYVVGTEQCVYYLAKLQQYRPKKKKKKED